MAAFRTNKADNPPLEFRCLCLLFFRTPMASSLSVYLRKYYPIIFFLSPQNYLYSQIYLRIATFPRRDFRRDIALPSIKYKEYVI